MNLRNTLVVFFAFASAACSVSTTEPGNGSSGSSGASQSSGGSPSSGAPASSGDRAGTYHGTYKGDASGPVKMIVGTDGAIEVTATVSGIDHKGSGKLEADGSVSLGVGVSSDVIVTFTGKIANGSGSGTWKSNQGTAGTWSVAK